jgi:hypothetical protein
MVLHQTRPAASGVKEQAYFGNDTMNFEKMRSESSLASECNLALHAGLRLSICVRRSHLLLLLQVKMRRFLWNIMKSLSKPAVKT